MELFEAVRRQLSESQDEVVSLRAENERLRLACSRESEEISQTLGLALGYPRFCDDPKHFPGATAANGVCVGDHVAVTLAIEAAARIERLKAEVERIRAKCNRMCRSASIEDIHGRRA